jgi:hypothetical protein
MNLAGQCAQLAVSAAHWQTSGTSCSLIISPAICLQQGVTKRCRLSWLTNSALIHEPKCEGSQPMSTAVHRSPSKLWRSNSIFNLWFTGLILNIMFTYDLSSNVFTGLLWIIMLPYDLSNNLFSGLIWISCVLSSNLFTGLIWNIMFKHVISAICSQA